MPVPVVPLIAAGANLLGQTINGIFQGGQNRKNRQFAKEMYAQQRKDALADWNMENEYNLPINQMKRFSDANLNPNLIYGDLSNSPSVRSTPASVPEGRAPQFDLGSVAQQGLESYFMNQIKTAQVDNIKQQTLNAAEQNKLIQAQVIATLTNTDWAMSKKLTEDQKRYISSQLLPGNLEAQTLNNQLTASKIENVKASTGRTIAQTDFTISENDRRNIMLAPNKKLAESKIALNKAMEVLTQHKIFLNTAQIKELESRINQNLSKTALNWQEFGNNEHGYNPKANILEKSVLSSTSTLKEWSKAIWQAIQDVVPPMMR